MARIAGVSFALMVCLAAPATSAPATAVSSGYVRIEPMDGEVGVAFDPSGSGRYVDAGIRLGAFGGGPGGEVVVADGEVRILGAPCVVPSTNRIEYGGPFDYGADLPAGGSLGQSFTVAEGQGQLASVWALLTCSGVEDSAATLTLRRDGPTGEVVARQRVQPLPNDYMVRLRLERPAPAGVYYLEISEKHGGCYWWSHRADAIGGGAAYEDGKLLEGDRCFGCELVSVGAVDIVLEPDGPDLTVRLSAQEGMASPPAAALSFPWQRDGYETDDPSVTPFAHLWTDSGYWLPVHAFKRLESDWALEPACAWAVLRGTRGFNLRVMHGGTSLRPRMSSDKLSLLLDDGATLRPEPDGAAMPEWMPRFFTSSQEVDTLANEFLWTFLTSHTSCPSSYEWDALKLAWVEGPMRDSLRRVVLHFTHRIDGDGFIWSRGESRGWDGSDCSESDSRHYDGNAPFILACWRLYCWTGDRGFLGEAMPTVRKATDYLLATLGGREGILTIRSDRHTGITEPPGASWPSDYFDCIPAGYQVAYINAFLRPALVASAELERAAGDEARAASLEAVAERARAAFDETFWDNDAGRYIGWVDAAGGRHDFGATYVNTIAATYALAPAERVVRMFDWMENQPTESGQTDTFSRWRFAPRSNTRHCSEQANRYPYEEWCEDGGAILWTAYYELMARARFLGADNAWARYRDILSRFAEPDHLVGGNPMYRGERNNHGGPPGNVGLWGEFPESGIAPCAFLYAFVGAEADATGLSFHPRVPAGLEYVGVEGLSWRGRRLKITAFRDRVVVEGSNGRQELPLDADGNARLLAEQ